VRPDAEHVDQGLKQLVAVEQRLAAKVRAAGVEAAALVAEAKQRAAAADTHAALEQTAADEERADQLAHTRAMVALERESRARVQAFEALSSGQIEALARRLADRAASGDDP
jgi:hypothetical protein